MHRLVLHTLLGVMFVAYQNLVSRGLLEAFVACFLSSCVHTSGLSSLPFYLRAYADPYVLLLSDSYLAPDNHSKSVTFVEPNLHCCIYPGYPVPVNFTIGLTLTYSEYSRT